MNIIRATLALTIIIYIGLGAIHHILDSTCLGIDCDPVFCPDNYAIKDKSGAYVPCETITEE